jgi:alpha-L-arabinofuranosidase
MNQRHILHYYISIFASFLLSILLFAPTSTELNAQQSRLEAVIDASETQTPINGMIYGQFIEHIGNIINHGLWAEMLDDRKFFHPVLEYEPEPDAAPGWRMPGRRWMPVGPPDRIMMDTRDPYAGSQSPSVILHPSEERGMMQQGLELKEGREYTGRIVLAADTKASVSLSLIWGVSPGDRETVSLTIPSGDYETHRFSFTARSKAEDARFEITATGEGSLLVGAVSLMPADNMDGFRREVVTLLKSLNSGVYRFPGGNFVSSHEWRHAIGDPDRRPPIWDPVWESAQPNDVGTDEFIALCRLLDVEPYITVNAGFGDAWSAAQLVEYANGSVDTPMGQLRAANGNPEPYGVKYWGIGNEAWGSWQMGAMALHQFVVKHNQFAEAMRAVDPSIVLIGSGAMPDAMTCSLESLRRTGSIVTEYLGPADWTGGLFLHCLDNLDIISEHFYTYGNERFDIEKGERVPLDADEPLVDWMRRPANHVITKVEAYADYLELIPELGERHITIALAEWAYSQVTPHSYKVVPAYAWVFHEMIRHSDLYIMGNFTFATSLVSSTRTDAVLNPAGLLFKLYANEFGEIPVTVSGNAPQTAPKYPTGGQDPRINAGSPTYPLDVVAAWTGDRQALTVAVINPTESRQHLHMQFSGVEFSGAGTVWQMAPEDLNARNLVGQTPEATIERHELHAVPESNEFPPHSITIYNLEVVN